MTTQTEALKALIAEMEYVLSCINKDKIPFDGDDFHEALRLGKEALAQPEQEPNHVATVAEIHMSRYTIEWTNGPLPEGAKLYDAPQRKPLTDEEKDSARWRFLVSNSFDKEGLAQFHVWHHTWEPHSQTSEPTEWKARVRGPALKRVIDEAIEAAHGIKE